jgi:hypothetical protein
VPILPDDEATHAPGPGRVWQESWYFNWSDPSRDAFGLARIGLRPNEGRADALVLTIREGRAEYLYPGVGLRCPSWPSIDLARGLRIGALTFSVEAPLRRHRLVLASLRGQMDLTFEALNEPWDYHAVDVGPGARGAHEEGFGSPMAAHHFEQFGRVRGETRFHGRRCAIDGLGERDKSWGERDWDRIEGWNWLTAQLGEDLAFNVLDVFDREGEGRRRHLAGFVCEAGKNHAIRDYRVDWTWGDRPHVPRGARIRLEHEGGSLELEATAEGRFPLYKGRAWIEEVKARFEVVGDANRVGRVGFGVLEHVHRPPLATALRHLPEIARGLSKAIFR